MKNKQFRAAKVRANSYDEDAGTVQIVWTTGAAVRRSDPYTGEEYDEILSLEPGAVDLSRLNSGAPLLDTHMDGCVGNIVGAVVAGTARIEDGRGVATILLSKAPGVADTVQKVREGTAKNVSVGYWVNSSTRKDGSPPIVFVDNWTPLEISVVPIPADPGSQIRSASGRRSERKTMSKEELLYEAGAAKARRLLGKAAPRTEPTKARGIVEAAKREAAGALKQQREHAQTVVHRQQAKR
jgi:phage head maturation protease